MPKVLEKGKIFGEGHTNHKNRGYVTRTILAPVVINGVRGNMGAVVRLDKSEAYYKVHRIIMPDGSIFVYKNENNNAETAGAYDKSKVALPTDIVIKDTVSQKDTSVNTYSMQNSENDVKKSTVLDSGTKFSLVLPIEETKDLLALHNLDEGNLLKTLDYEGIPMPSIAITKDTIPHTNFGSITLIFDKNTIDPQKSGNKVYSADAWTPTFPGIEYSANDKVAKSIRDKFYNLSSKYGIDAVNALYGYANYLEDELNRFGGVSGIIEKEKDNTEMMKVYLADKGKDIPKPVVVQKTSYMDQSDIDFCLCK